MAAKRNAFIDKLVDDPANPPQTMLLSGYVGKAADDDHTRLYLDPELSSYYDIPNEAVLHTENLTQEGSPWQRDLVWVDREAAQGLAPQGAGDLHGAEAVPTAVCPTQLGCPQTASCPPTSLLGCPSTSTCPPTSAPGCPSTSACPPTTAPGCPDTSSCPPTSALGCPNTSTCPPTSAFGCPNTSTCPPTSAFGCPNTSTCPPTSAFGCPNTSTCPPTSAFGCPNTSTCPPTSLVGCPNTATCPPTTHLGCPSTSTCPPPTLDCLITADCQLQTAKCPPPTPGCVPMTSRCPSVATVCSNTTLCPAPTKPTLVSNCQIKTFSDPDCLRTAHGPACFDLPRITLAGGGCLSAVDACPSALAECWGGITPRLRTPVLGGGTVGGGGWTPAGGFVDPSG